jgi:hypothetical protein
MAYKWGLLKWTARNTLPIGVNAIRTALLMVDSVIFWHRHHSAQTILRCINFCSGQGQVTDLGVSIMLHMPYQDASVSAQAKAE